MFLMHNSFCSSLILCTSYIVVPVLLWYDMLGGGAPCVIYTYIHVWCYSLSLTYNICTKF